ncbi:hypothetical protein SOVF_168540 [Spinacia oleracea]|nr:hypothetical protein SOVF_168540 [Spinacia oleracea]
MSMILTKTAITFSSLFFFLSLVSVNGILDDHRTLIFNRCSSRKLDDPNGEYLDARTTLFDKLHSKSSQSKSDTTFVMVGENYEGSISGRFQCRQDLDDHKCNECMEEFQNVTNGLCGSSMAARIQLSGCHVQYEADTYNGIFSLDEELHHKKCGEPQDVVSNEYYEQIRSQAFEALESEAAGGEGNNGFYSINNHEGFHAMAQCEVGMDECDCAKCVVEAVEVVEKECVSSIYGQVYLGSCYLSYEFNPLEFHGGSGFHGGKYA